MQRFWVACLLGTIPSFGAEVSGRVLDPSGAAIAGARVAARNRVGLVRETTTNSQGDFHLPADKVDVVLVISAPGFARREIRPQPDQALEVRLELAPVHDAITVSGSAIAAPLGEQATSISLIPRSEIALRNEASLVDLLRGVPGVAVSQTGHRGGAASLFVRGGDSKYNLVLIDGVPVNDMRLGGYFDFAHLPTDHLDRIEVIRGPQSAVYGSYANAGVVNVVTRLEEAPPQLDLLAEGGTFATHRFAAAGAGSWRGFRVAASASRLDTDGDVVNSDYRNENLSLNLGRRFRRQDLSFRGGFNSSENGVPGPYGSNHAGNFAGLDRVSRNANNFSTYLVRYDLDVTPRLRQEIFGSFFLNNNSYRDGSGSMSFNKDLRGTGEARTTVSVSERYTLAFGFAFSREEVKNTFISDDSFRAFPLRRDQEGIYLENRFRLARRLFINAGARAEVIQTPRIPGNSAFGRPEFAAQTIERVNPKLGVAWVARPSTRMHASFGTGIRPPGGFDLAFTNNPALKPERTLSVDAGIEQQFGSRVLMDATYFHNRYDDLIVSLGGSLSRLGSYRSDNLANSRAQGVELAGHWRPSIRVAISGHYTWLDTEILALDEIGRAHV